MEYTGHFGVPRTRYRILNNISKRKSISYGILQNAEVRGKISGQEKELKLLRLTGSLNNSNLHILLP